MKPLMLYIGLKLLKTRFFTSIFSRISQGICIFHTRGSFFWANTHAEKIFQTKDLTFKTFQQLLNSLEYQDPGSTSLSQEVQSLSIQKPFVCKIFGKFIKIHPSCLGHSRINFWILNEEKIFFQMDKTTHSFLNSFSIPFIIHTFSGKILDANQAFKAWLGYDSAVLKKKSLKDISLRNSSLGDKDSLKELNIYVFKDGEGNAFYGQCVQSFHIDEKKTLTGLFFQPCDNPLKEPSKNPALFSLFIQNIPLPAVFLNRKGAIVLANRLFEKIIRERKILGHDLTKWIEKDLKSAYTAFLEKVRRAKETLAPFAAKLNKENSLHLNLYITYMPKVSWDKMGGFCVLVHDITTFKKYEVQTAESQRLQSLGQLASGISHDFNNLLTAMLGFCDLLLQRHQPHDHSFTDIMQIKQNANRAASLIRQLLLFAKETPLAPKAINLRECLNEMSFLLRRLIGTKIDLKIEHDPQVRSFYADQGQIEQLVMNLAINARDAMPKGGRLIFRTSHQKIDMGKKVTSGTLKPGSYVRIEVEDTGCGISKENLPKIFHPFFSTKESGQGTGLGLATVIKIVKNMKGGVDVSSVVDKGTIFCLYLLEQTVVPLKTSVSPHSEGQLLDFWEAAQILIVEDEDPVRLFASRGLRSKGYEVLEARDGLQGLDVLKQRPHIKLLITDVMMPAMDGPALANACYAINPQLQVLFVSGYPEEEIHLKLRFPKDQIHFLPKPFNLDDLTQKARTILQAKKRYAQL